MKLERFEGCWTALVTPFNRKGEIDFEGMEKNILFQMENGANLIPTGTTGESPTLDWREHDRVITKTAKLAKGKVFVMAGTGSNSTKEAMRGTRSNIKSALMSQERIAGIGNIYSDEILFQARLYPKAKANQLNDRILERLFTGINEVLNTAIESQADPGKLPRHYLIPQRGKGGKCPVCNGEITAMKISGRTAYFCPTCQSNGTV